MGGQNGEGLNKRTKKEKQNKGGGGLVLNLITFLTRQED